MRQIEAECVHLLASVGHNSLIHEVYGGGGGGAAAGLSHCVFLVCKALIDQIAISKIVATIV